MEVGKVYVIHNDWIQDPETGNMPYKIGITKSTIENRFYGLGLKMPGEFVCDFAYEFGETYAKVEKTLHNMLNQLNVNGEWFNVNEEALEGIINICELAGGKLITDKVEIEIENETCSRNNDFEKIINKWNERSTLKAVGNSVQNRKIFIPGVNKTVRYIFGIKDKKNIFVALNCRSKEYTNFSNFFSSYNGKNINGKIFNYPELTPKERRNGFQGKIWTIIPLTDIDTAIETMDNLINETKEKIIKECNEK